jgi:hypothetical protein
LLLGIAFGAREQNRAGHGEGSVGADGKPGDVDGNLGDVDGETGDVDGKTGDVDGKTGDVDGQSGDVDGSSGDVDGSSGDVDGKMGDVDGETGDVDGSSGDVDGETGDVDIVRTAAAWRRSACPRRGTSPEVLSTVWKVISTARETLPPLARYLARSAGLLCRWKTARVLIVSCQKSAKR